MDEVKPTEKRCSRCGAAKPLDAFYPCRRGPLGRSSWCKVCQKADTAARRTADRGKHRARARTRYHERRDHVRALARARYAADPGRFLAINAKSKYGVTPETRAEMLRRQCGGCAICGKPEGAAEPPTGLAARLQVDHDHRTGRVRWLLCHQCNSMIAMARDDPVRLERAAHLLRAGRDAAPTEHTLMADAEFMSRVHARAARQAEAQRAAAPAFVPPGPPVPESTRAETVPSGPSPPVAVGSPGTQKERTRRLHDHLAEVINAHGASPETVLMALELLRHQALAPRLRQLELE